MPAAAAYSTAERALAGDGAFYGNDSDGIDTFDVLDGFVDSDDDTDVSLFDDMDDLDGLDGVEDDAVARHVHEEQDGGVEAVQTLVSACVSTRRKCATHPYRWLLGVRCNVVAFAMHST